MKHIHSVSLNKPFYVPKYRVGSCISQVLNIVLVVSEYQYFDSCFLGVIFFSLLFFLLKNKIAVDLFTVFIKAMKYCISFCLASYLFLCIAISHIGKNAKVKLAQIVAVIRCVELLSRTHKFEIRQP